MKIRMKADISGSRNGKPWPGRGETTEVPDGEGADLCAAGLAEPVADRKGKVETATPPADDEQRQESKSGPVTTESAPAVAKKAAPRKTTTTKAAAAKQAEASASTSDGDAK